MPGEKVPVPVEDGRDRGVACPGGDLLRAGPGGYPQGDGRVPEVVGPERLEPGRSDRRPPCRARQPLARRAPPSAPRKTSASGSARPNVSRWVASSSATKRGSGTFLWPARVLGGPKIS